MKSVVITDFGVSLHKTSGKRGQMELAPIYFLDLSMW